jgi:fused
MTILLNTCVNHYSYIACDIPLGLLARLILTDENLAQLIIDQLNNTQEIIDFFIKILYQQTSSDSIIADIYSILSHLSRKSEDSINIICKILKGPTDNYQILIKSLQGSSLVRARCCNMIGNLMRHNDTFYQVLKKHKEIYQCLVQCCQIDELNVRKSAILAIGNSVYHNDQLIDYLNDILSIIITLLKDPLAKTRIHATATIGNLAMYKFTDKMAQLKIPQKILEIACNDTQFIVKETALLVLRSLCNHDKAKKILKDLDAVEKLSNMDFLTNPKVLDSSCKNNFINAANICKIIIQKLEIN